MGESPQQQIDRLAKFIMEEVPGEPSEDQGAVDTAIRLIRDKVDKEAAFEGAMAAAFRGPLGHKQMEPTDG